MSTTTKAKPLVQKFTAIRDEISASLVERAEEVELMMQCWLGQVHLLFLGPPGVAKSMMIELLHGHVKDLEVFLRLVFMQTPVEEILGPVSLKALEQDIFRRDTTGKLPEAHIAVLDEVFKASSQILNPTLRIINERKYENDGALTDCPLHFLVCASNELPSNDRDDLQAFNDRLTARKIVDRVQADEGFKTVLRDNGERLRGKVSDAGTRTVVTLAEYEAMRKLVLATEVPETVLDAVTKLRRSAQQEGLIGASDRRITQGLALMQAKAALDGRDRVEESDLMVYQHVLWTDIEDQRKAYSLTLPFVSELERKLARFRDEYEPEAAAVEQLRQVQAAGEIDAEFSKKATDTMRKLGKIREKLQETMTEAASEGRDITLFEDLNAVMRDAQVWCIKEGLGMTADDVSEYVD